MFSQVQTRWDESLFLPFQCQNQLIFKKENTYLKLGRNYRTKWNSFGIVRTNIRYVLYVTIVSCDFWVLTYIQAEGALIHVKIWSMICFFILYTTVIQINSRIDLAIIYLSLSFPQFVRFIPFHLHFIQFKPYFVRHLNANDTLNKPKQT